MNLLILPSWYPTPENETMGIFVQEQILELKKKDINIFVLYLNAFSIRNLKNFLNIKQKYQYYDDNGIKTYILYYLNIFPKLRILFFHYSALLLKICYNHIIKQNKISFDLVHIHSVFYAGFFYHLSKIPVKYIITEHSTFYSRNLVYFWEKYFLPGLLSNSSEIIAVSNGLKKEIQKYTQKRITIIYNLVSFTNRSYQLDNDKRDFRFFALGMDFYKKGFDILLSAYSKTKILDKTELVIAGLNDKEIVRIKEILKGTQIKNIKLMGRLPKNDVGFNMYNCDCFVLPSRYETFGIVFAEAMFFGKPVIASTTGGPDSFVSPEAGILVPVENIDETAKALEQMYYNYQNYDSHYISHFAKETFSSEVITHKIIAIYENLLKINPGGNIV